MTHRGITPQQELYMAILLVGIAFVMLFSTEQPESTKSSSPSVLGSAESKSVRGSLPIPGNDNTRIRPEESRIQSISGEEAFFESMSSEITLGSALEARLREVAREIARKGADGVFDGLEVTGHADTEPVFHPQEEKGHINTRRTFEFPADLDSLMAARARGALSIRLSTKATTNRPGRPSDPINMPEEGKWRRELTPSNVDLAMMRALSVVRFFKAYKETDPSLHDLSFIKVYVPLSAGAFIALNGTLDLDPHSQDNQKTKDEIDKANRRRRRIEFHIFHTTERFPRTPETAAAAAVPAAL